MQITSKYKFCLIIALILGSCNKDVPITDDLEYLIGDYDYVYSKLYDGSYIVSQSMADQYGIRITKKNKLYFFKNGTETAKYKLEKQPGVSKDKTYIYYKISHNSWATLYYSGDTIFGPSPIAGAENYFLKKP